MSNDCPLLVDFERCRRAGRDSPGKYDQRSQMVPLWSKAIFHEQRASSSYVCVPPYATTRVQVTPKSVDRAKMICEYVKAPSFHTTPILPLSSTAIARQSRCPSGGRSIGRGVVHCTCAFPVSWQSTRRRMLKILCRVRQPIQAKAELQLRVGSLGCVRERLRRCASSSLYTQRV
mgnify:CR=1 FL=1